MFGSECSTSCVFYGGKLTSPFPFLSLYATSRRQLQQPQGESLESSLGRCAHKWVFHHFSTTDFPSQIDHYLGSAILFRSAHCVTGTTFAVVYATLRFLQRRTLSNAYGMFCQKKQSQRVRQARHRHCMDRMSRMRDGNATPLPSTNRMWLMRSAATPTHTHTR